MRVSTDDKPGFGITEFSPTPTQTRDANNTSAMKKQGSGNGDAGKKAKPKPNAFANAFQQLALKTKDAIAKIESDVNKAKLERDEKKRRKNLNVRK